jgi:hypothetical protein
MVPGGSPGLDRFLRLNLVRCLLKGRPAYKILRLQQFRQSRFSEPAICIEAFFLVKASLQTRFHKTEALKLLEDISKPKIVRSS